MARADVGDRESAEAGDECKKRKCTRERRDGAILFRVGTSKDLKSDT